MVFFLKIKTPQKRLNAHNPSSLLCRFTHWIFDLINHYLIDNQQLVKNQKALTVVRLVFKVLTKPPTPTTFDRQVFQLTTN